MTEVTYKVYYYDKLHDLQDVSDDFDTEAAAVAVAKDNVGDETSAEIVRVEATAIKRVTEAKKIVVTKL